MLLKCGIHLTFGLFSVSSSSRMGTRAAGRLSNGDVPQDVDTSNPEMCTQALLRAEDAAKALKAVVTDANNRCDAAHFPVSLSLANDLLASLKAGCHAMDVGDASRSDAKFAMTQDRRFVLKVIKKSEIMSLRRLAGLEQPWWSQHILSENPDSDSNVQRRIRTELGLLGGVTYWINEECDGDFLKFRWCFSLEDPGYAYKNQMLSGENLMVPFYLYDLTSSIAVMPNFLQETERIMDLLLPAHPQMEKYDVKPIQVKNSKERGPFLARLLDLRWEPKNDATLICGGPCPNGDSLCQGVVCWTQLLTQLETDINFLTKGRPHELVDYSLVFMLASAVGGPLHHGHRPSASALPPSCIISIKDGETVVLCVRLLDYLMEKTFRRRVESFWKKNKYDQYGKKMQKLLACIGDLRDGMCTNYLEIACLEHAARIGTHMPSWCALVPSSTKGIFDSADHCPLADAGWTCDDNLTTNSEEEDYCADNGVRNCDDLTNQLCQPWERMAMGYSPRMKRQASALEACCCPAFGDTYPMTHEAYGQHMLKIAEQHGLL